MNNSLDDKNIVLSNGNALTIARSDLIKRGLSLINTIAKIVLIVDDDQELSLSLKDGLEKYNDQFSMVFASDGQMAVEMIEKHAISIVVTNINMPKLSGIELLAYIKENYPDIHVIIMTGMGGPEIESLYYDVGATYFLEKPFRLDDLANIVTANLDKKPVNKLKSAYAWFYLGRCYKRLGHLRKSLEILNRAVEAYKHVIELKPNLIEAFDGLGNVYIELGRHREAIEMFKQAINFEPDDMEAHTGLGIIYLQSGNKKAALKEYEMLNRSNSYRILMSNSDSAKLKLLDTMLRQNRGFSFKTVFEDLTEILKKIEIFKNEKQQD